MGKIEGKGLRGLKYLLTQKKSHCIFKTRRIQTRSGDSGKSGVSGKDPEYPAFQC
jgi:hypothetical protein